MSEIGDAHFVLIDTETSGRDATNCELLEVAAIHLDANGNSFARFETLVRPTKPVPHEVSGIHGITDADVEHAPTLAIVEAALAGFVPPNAICVAHNAAYDSLVLHDVLGDRRWLCSERLAHHIDPDAPNFKLGTLRYRYGHHQIDTMGLSAHRALADVLVLARVFGTLLDRYLLDAQYDRRRDMVQQLLDFTASPYEVKTMMFGKHVGTPISEVPTSYLQWGLSSNGLDDEDMRYTFRREIGRRSGRSKTNAIDDKVGLFA